MKKLTVVLDDDGLYTAVKVEAARRNRPVKEIVAEALQAWLESQEDAELQEEIAAARAEWREKGGREASEFFQELQSSGGS